jgi:hypothetical protein
MKVIVAIALLMITSNAWADRFGILESTSYFNGEGLNLGSLIGLFLGLLVARAHEGDGQLYIVYGFIGLGAGSLVGNIF